MSETRRKFMRMISTFANRVYANAATEHFSPRAMSIVAEAVYAHALNDVYKSAQNTGLDIDTVSIQEHVAAFAAERGIDLTEGEETP